MLISNRSNLVRNGAKGEDRKAREIALGILEVVLAEADPYVAVKKALSLDDGILKIENYEFDLDKYGVIYVIGAGKAAGGMGEAVENILGSRISSGSLNIPMGTKNRFSLNQIKLSECSHPIPRVQDLDAAKKIFNIAKDASEGDLVIVLISGGASSLLTLPSKGVPLESIQSLTDSLLKSGAKIGEINSIRKHISNIKGGRLAEACHPAEVVSLIISDVVGDPLEVIASGPTVPDPTTFKSALKNLEKYDLALRYPEIKDHLEKGLLGSVPETLKEGSPIFESVHNFLISSNEQVLRKVLEIMSKKYDSTLITTELEGEASTEGKKMSVFLMREKELKNPNSPPKVFLGGGETTVTVKGTGIGGRNQELVLSALAKLRGRGMAIVSIGTDGIDGSTEAAGAIADGSSQNKAKNLGLEPKNYLDNNDSYHFFKALDDLILTGATGTNINDILVMVTL
jgi:glycerate-2-kinase